MEGKIESKEVRRGVSTKPFQREQISRRGFLKILVTGGVVLGGEAAGLGILAGSRGTYQASPEKASAEVKIYGEEGASYIREIETHLNLILPLPGEVLMPGEYNEKYGRSDITPGSNVVWQKEELMLLAEVTGKLPKSYGSGLPVALLAKYSIENDHYGGSWTKPHVSIFTPKFWNPSTPSVVPEIWKSISQEFQGVLVHELTHRMLEENPELLDKYARAVGWEKDYDKWVLNGELGIVKKLWIYEGGSYEAHKSPNEDIAISMSIFVTNPEAFLTGDKSDQSRYDFFRASS